MNPAPSSPEVADLHEGAFVVDAHDDRMVDVVKRRISGERAVLKQRHLPMIIKGGVNLSVLTCGGDHSNMFDGADQPGWALDAIRAIDELCEEIKESDGDIVLVETTEDLDLVATDNAWGVLIHFEGGRPLEGQLGMLRQFHRLGLRSIGLVWFLRNHLADSCAERNAAGLSHFGAAVVREAERLGMVIDIAHLSERGSFDVLDITEQPIVASHANARALQDHPRNLSDTLIKAVAGSGGVIGLAAFPPFISSSSSPTLNELLNHADHISELVGTDHVGLGLDFIDFAPEAFLAYHTAIAESIGIDLGSEDVSFPAEISDISMVPNITKRLLDRGYSDDDVKKLLGDNFMRVYRQVLPSLGNLPNKPEVPGQ